MIFLVKNILLVAVVFLGAILAKATATSRLFGVWQKTFIPFGGAFLLGVVILHVFPLIFGSGSTQEMISLFVLLGFIVQLGLDYFSGGVEHGHVHHHGMGRFSILSLLAALSIHSLLEGFPMGHDHLHGSSGWGGPFFVGVVLHKLPAAFTLTLLLMMTPDTKRWLWWVILFFSMMTPLGNYLGHVIPLTPAQSLCVLALVAGSLLHISTTFLFEMDESGAHRIPMKQLIAILLGFLLSYLSTQIGIE